MNKATMLVIFLNRIMNHIQQTSKLIKRLFKKVVNLNTVLTI